VDSKGFCFYKATNGIKRHLAVDTLGFPFFNLCTPANLSDNAELIQLLTQNIDYFRSKPVNLPKMNGTELRLVGSAHPRVNQGFRRSARAYFSDILPKITILVDHGYHPDALRQALEKVYPQIMRKIKFEQSPKPSKAEKAAAGQTGFVPVAAHWVVERSNAWMERCKSSVKNFERTLSNATTQLNLCFVRLMLKRLATAA
jgi:transposase